MSVTIGSGDLGGVGGMVVDERVLFRWNSKGMLLTGSNSRSKSQSTDLIVESCYLLNQ